MSTIVRTFPVSTANGKMGFKAILFFDDDRLEIHSFKGFTGFMVTSSSDVYYNNELLGKVVIQKDNMVFKATDNSFIDLNESSSNVECYITAEVNLFKRLVETKVIDLTNNH